jgi:Catalase
VAGHAAAKPVNLTTETSLISPIQFFIKSTNHEEIGNVGKSTNWRVEVAPLTTQQGTPVSDDQNSLRIGKRGPTALEDFHFRERSSTLITSAFPSASSTPEAMARTAILKTTILFPISRWPICSSVPAKKRRFLYVSRPLPAIKFS